MFQNKTVFIHNCLACMFLSTVAIALMGAGYVIPEAGFNGAWSKMQQYGKSYAVSPGQIDRNCDGRIDLIIADRNGDGVPDYWATDRDYDGKFDDYQYDRNFDGKIDQWEYDLDQDGISDKIYVDTTGDGKPDLFAVLNPVTRTYTWYGNISNGNAYAKAVKNKVYRQGRGRRGDSN